MSTKSRWFVGVAGAALLAGRTRLVPSIPGGDGLADFLTGFAAALMLGALVTWRARRAS